MSQVDIDTSIDTLTGNFSKEIELYGTVFALTKKENETILSGDIEQTLKFVKEKQDILQLIEKIDREQAPLKKVWQENKQRILPEKKNKLQETLAVLGKLLEDLILIEKNNEKVISERISKIKSKGCGSDPVSRNVADAYRETKEKKDR